WTPEDVVQITIIALRPQVMPGDGINKLGSDTDLITDLPDTSLQDISHAQLAAYVRDLYRPVLVRKRRNTGHPGKPTGLREIGDDIVSDAVGEVLLLRVVAHVRERKHRDGRLFAHLESRPSLRRLSPWWRLTARGGVHPHPINTHRLVDVLEDLLSERLAIERQLVRNLVTQRARDTDAAAFGKPLDPGRDVHPVPVDSVTLNNHLAEIDTNPELHAAVNRQGSVSRGEFLLDTDGALDGGHHAGKLGEEVIPWRVHHAPAMLAHQRGH